MKVFNPYNNPNHVLQFTGRYDSNLVDFTITNNQKIVLNLTAQPVTITDGYTLLPFIFYFIAETEYTAEVKDSETQEVLHRCKIFATSQTDLENYKINPSVIYIQ